MKRRIFTIVDRRMMARPSRIRLIRCPSPVARIPNSVSANPCRSRNRSSSRNNSVFLVCIYWFARPIIWVCKNVGTIAAQLTGAAILANLCDGDGAGIANPCRHLPATALARLIVIHIKTPCAIFYSGYKLHCVGYRVGFAGRFPDRSDKSRIWSSCR